MTWSALIVGGFGLPPVLLRQLARDLDGTIVRTGLTIACGEVEARKVVDAIDRTDGPVVLIGHSRGGQLARVAAARRPNCVDQLITVGTPAALGPPNRWGVPTVAAMMRRVRGPVAMNCATGACCADLRADLERDVPMPWTAIVSRRDRIVRPTETMTQGATIVEVDASHVGLVMSAQGRAEILRRVRCGPSARCRRDEDPA